METQILEGTFTEVQRRLSILPLRPETYLRIIVTETEKSTTLEERFANAPRRNGLILQDAPGLTTTEEVKEALYRAELEDVLGENWEEKQIEPQNTDAGFPKTNR